MTESGAVANLNIPPFSKFDLQERSTISTRWKKYQKKFLNLCTALNIKDDQQKLALLLNYVGDELYDVYDNLLLPGTKETYEEAIKLLDNHVNPKNNTCFETYQFHQLTQNIDETLHIRVKQQAVKCGFKDEEKEIKMRLILGTRSNKLRRHAFKTPKITQGKL